LTPTMTVTQAAVNAAENLPATNSTSYGDYADPVSVSGPGVTDHGDGTWRWSGTGDEDQPYDLTVTATNADGTTSTTSFHVSFTDVAPTVSVTQAAVSAAENLPASNSGSYGDYDDAV